MTASWYARAACLGTPTVVFYSDDPTDALATCARCPVVTACRDAADQEETPATTDGVRGAETAAMRLARRARETPRGSLTCPTCGFRAADARGLGSHQRVHWSDTELHGTEAGYKRHRRQGEPACPACPAGQADAVARRSRRRSA